MQQQSYVQQHFRLMNCKGTRVGVFHNVSVDLYISL